MERLDGLTGKLKPFGSGPRETTLIAYYLFPDQENAKRGGRGVWQAAARGEFDVHHRKIAAALARYQGPYIFRIGHEWNGDEFSWGVTDPSLAPSKDYFKRTADILRRANPGGLVDWCCLKRGSARVSIQNFYPGGKWVVSSATTATTVTRLSGTSGLDFQIQRDPLYGGHFRPGRMGEIREVGRQEAQHR